MKSYYEVLNLTITASQEQINIASETEQLRIQEQESEQNQEEKLAAVAEAHTVLSNPKLRQQFHREYMYDLKKEVETLLTENAWVSTHDFLCAINVGMKWLKWFMEEVHKPSSAEDKDFQVADKKLHLWCLQLSTRSEMKRGDFSEAVGYLQEAITLDPQNPITYAIRSELYCSLQKLTEAYDDYLRIVSLGGIKKEEGVNTDQLLQGMTTDQLLQRITQIDYTLKQLAWPAVQRLAKSLMFNNVITRILILDHCGLNVRGLEALITALANNQTVTAIDLSRNPLADEGAEMVANMLKTNTTLREVNLCKTEIVNKGFIALANALPKNNTLTSLNLKYNKMEQTSDQYAALVQSVQQNQGLTTFVTDVVDDKIVQKVLDRNNRLATIWSLVAVVTSFVRANNCHPFRYSALPLLEKSKTLPTQEKDEKAHEADKKVVVKTIKDFMGECSTKALLDIHGFLASKYFCSVAKDIPMTLPPQANKKRKAVSNVNIQNDNPSLSMTLRQ